MRVGPEVPRTQDDGEVAVGQDTTSVGPASSSERAVSAPAPAPGRPPTTLASSSECAPGAAPLNRSAAASPSDRSHAVASSRTEPEPEQTHAGSSDTVDDDPPSRSDRVARIRAAVASGNYPVDLDKLAEKIVEREALAAGKRNPNDDNSS